MRNVNLNRAKLAQAEFDNCPLNDASMEDTDCRFVQFKSCNFTCAKLRNALFFKQSLAGAAMDGADLSGADFREVDLSKSSLILAKMVGTNFRKANLKECNFSKAQATEADFGASQLSLSNFAGANLSHADMRFAILIGSNFKGANLMYADLTCADLRQAHILSANFWGTSTKKAQIDGGAKLGVMPFIVLGKLFFPFQKKFKQHRVRTEKLKKQRAEELIQTAQPKVGRR
jgi:uncharacterized protein YjbI with pentapeptide repeats